MNSTSEKIAGHSKLKFWTFYWGHGEHEWPSEKGNSLILIYQCTCMYPILWTGIFDSLLYN